MSGTMSTIEHGKIVRRLFLTIHARNFASFTGVEDAARIAAEMWLRSETLDRLWPERMAAIEQARTERHAALAALDPWALRDARNRATPLTHTACAALHVAYLHLVKGLEWSDAVSRVRQAPANAWWTDELVPMSEDERAARRVLGLLYPEPT